MDFLVLDFFAAAAFGDAFEVVGLDKRVELRVARVDEDASASGSSACFRFSSPGINSQKYRYVGSKLTLGGISFEVLAKNGRGLIQIVTKKFGERDYRYHAA